MRKKAKAARRLAAGDDEQRAAAGVSSSIAQPRPFCNNHLSSLLTQALEQEECHGAAADHHLAQALHCLHLARAAQRIRQALEELAFDNGGELIPIPDDMTFVDAAAAIASEVWP